MGINSPHPDSSPEEADAFFGDQATSAPDPATFNPETGEFNPAEFEQEIEAEAAATAAEPELGGLPTLTPEQAAAEGKAYAEHHALATPEPEPEPELEPRPMAPVKQSGDLEREYIVFQSVQLTDRMLRKMLEEIEQGTVAEPRVAFLELHRAVSRNDKAAIGEAYNVNREALGPRCELAAVSSRSFKKRRVEPKQPREASVSIT